MIRRHGTDLQCPGCSSWAGHVFVRKNPGWTSPWTLVLLRANPPLGTPTDPPFTARSRVWVFQDQCVGLSGSLGVPSQKPKTRLISKCSDHGVFGIGVSWNAIGVLYASRTSVYARQLHQIRILGSVPPGLRSFRQNCFTARWVAFPTTFPTLPRVFVQNPTLRSSPWQEFPQPVALHARCSDSEKQTPFVSQMLGVGALDGRELGVQLIGLRDKSGGGRKANLRI